MSSRISLYATNDATGSAETTLVAEARLLPLLWLAMFQAKDLVSEKLGNEEIEITGKAVASLASVKKRLMTSLPLLNAMFQKQGTLDDYGSLLLNHLESAKKKFVVLDFLDRVAYEQDEDIYAEKVACALNGLEEENLKAIFVIPASEVMHPIFREMVPVKQKKLKSLKEILVHLCSLDEKPKFPLANYASLGLKISEAAEFCHHSLIGDLWTDEKAVKKKSTKSGAKAKPKKR